MGQLTRILGIARSLGMYHGIPFRSRRLIRHYARFVNAGSLCFDLGAHAGNRIGAWRSLGAQVIAIEPQPDFVHLLQRLYGDDPGVKILPVAVGEQSGRARLLLSERTPTVTTLSGEWIRRVGGTEGFRGIRWETGPEVCVTTLDELISRFGVPRFVKIDVEGMEAAVLRGLSQPIQALSFEYLPPAREVALESVSRLEALGGYVYNWSVGETHRLVADHWLDGPAMTAMLKGLPMDAPSGDVYARLGEDAG